MVSVASWSPKALLLCSDLDIHSLMVLSSETVTRRRGLVGQNETQLTHSSCWRLATWQPKCLQRISCIIPHICHRRHGYTRVNFFLAGVNFYRFNAKNWHFRQILRGKVAFFFYRFNAKSWRFSV